MGSRGPCPQREVLWTGGGDGAPACSSPPWLQIGWEGPAGTARYLGVLGRGAVLPDRSVPR